MFTRADRQRRFEALIELLPPGDPVLDELSARIERRLIELAAQASVMDKPVRAA